LEFSGKKEKQSRGKGGGEAPTYARLFRQKGTAFSDTKKDTILNWEIPPRGGERGVRAQLLVGGGEGVAKMGYFFLKEGGLTRKNLKLGKKGVLNRKPKESTLFKGKGGGGGGKKGESFSVLKGVEKHSTNFDA